jgi:acylphosphatase
MRNGLKSLRLIVTGRVQGVGYRYFVAHHARLLGIQGFAKNASDGSVVLECEGEEQAVGHLVELCRQGPPRAVVNRLDTNDIPFQGYLGFSIR